MWKKLCDAFGPKIVLPDVRHMPSVKQGVIPWMWFFIRPYYPAVIFGVIIRAIRYTSYGLITYMFSLIIDALQSGWVVQNTPKFWMNLSLISVFYLLVMLSFQLLMYESNALDKVQRGMTMFSIRHLLALPLDWHEQQGSGGKLQRVMQARENLRQIYFSFARRIMSFLGEAVAIVIVIHAMDVPSYMLLLFLGYVVNYMIAFSMLNKRVDILNEAQNNLKEKLVSRIYDFISLIRVTKSFSLDEYVMDRSVHVENESHTLQRRIKFFQHFRWAAINFFVWTWVMLIMICGIHQVIDHRITVGAFSALIFMAYRLWSTLEEIVMVQIDYVEYKAGFIKIRETLSAQVQNYDIDPVIKMPENWQQIECRNMQFSYHPEHPVLKNIDLVIPRGKHIALIGHSGAGKSTMVKLLMKQIRPTQGELLVGNAALENIESNDWLSHLALVPQDVELMNATLRENILLDRDEIDEDFYRECLRKAYLEEFIRALPDGDNTQIGERGVKLSGGQKQRLGIARALVRNAQVIILDEATSALDSESEAYIQRAMETAFSDKTVIVIAHRLSTIRHADTIYVFDKGYIAESGDFAALEKNNGIFARLWAMQSNGFIAD